MILTADSIVEGVVLSRWAALDSRGEIVTHNLIGIDAVLKGSAGASSIDLVEPGGFLGNEARVVSGVPVYEVGEKVLVFVYRDQAGTPQTHQLQLGKFEMQWHGSEAVFKRGSTTEELNGYLPDGSRYVERARYAAAFREYIRAVSRGNSPPPDYYVPERTRGIGLRDPGRGKDGNQASSASSTRTACVPACPGAGVGIHGVLGISPASHVPSSSYSLPGPFRWTKFDAGGTATFQTNGTQPRSGSGSPPTHDAAVVRLNLRNSIAAIEHNATDRPAPGRSGSISSVKERS